MENEALFLSSLFDRTRTEARNAVAAVNGYKELMEGLKTARNMTIQASLNAEHARKFHKEGAVMVKYLEGTLQHVLYLCFAKNRSHDIIFLLFLSFLQNFAINIQVTLAKTLREQSADLLRSAIDLKQSSINNVDNLKVAFVGKASELQFLIGKQKGIIESLHLKFDDKEVVGFYMKELKGQKKEYFLEKSIQH